MDIISGVSGIFALATIVATLGYLAYASDGRRDDSRPSAGDSQAR